MFYILVDSGIIKAVGNTKAEMSEINSETYNTISNLLSNKPEPPDRWHDYRLTVGLEWELFEIRDDGKDIDDSEAVSILMGE